MERRQFRVLYRQFLFGIVDPEALSVHAKGDAGRLLARFAALLVAASFTLACPALFLGDKAAGAQDPASFVATMVGQHVLVATTMLVVGLFGVLSWDATFPGRRDLFVLLPLPVRARTILASKILAAATALALAVVLLHSLLGLIWPLVFWLRSGPVRLPALRFEPTPTALTVGELKRDLDRALADTLTNGSLQPGTGAGLAIGVFKRGERQILTYGAARPDSIFEIGSITKTFTGLLLARMVSEGRTRLDEPVRELLPRGLVGPATGDEMTLADLATHHSGLPMMPDNFVPADPANPYADYRVSRLYDFVRRRGTVKPEDTLYRYSNVGVGLLGQALAERARTGYPRLLRDQIAAPLGLNDTTVTLSAEQRLRFLQGYDDRHKPVHEWDFDALAGAGGIRSTAPDMLRYLEANLHPERHAELTGALRTTQRVRGDAAAGTVIGLAWTYHPETGAYRHGGTTGGFTSHAFFVPRCDCAAVVLMNSGANLVFNPDLVAEHIRQRLTGEPAVTLDTVVVPATAGLAGVARSYASYWFTMCAAGVFVYGLILGIQGVLALTLRRGPFLRLSGYVQILAFCVSVGFFFLQPGLGGLEDLTARATWRFVQWTPSYWFLGLYQQLNGTLHPRLLPLAQRAWIGLAVVLSGSAVAFALSYSRTLRQIVEAPDIPLAPPGWRRLPPLGDRYQTAVGQFVIRTLLRSKQHRLTVALYLGIGLAFAGLLLKDPSTKRALADSAAGNPWRDASVALWAASVIFMTLAVMGTRVAFGMPADLRANWIFQVMGARTGRETATAARRPLWVLAVAPVWLGSAAVCLGLWPSWPSVWHMVTLALIGLILVELCLLNFRKIPFACSYLPGRLRIEVLFLGAILLLLGSVRLAVFEHDALNQLGGALAWVVSFVFLWFVARLVAWNLARGSEETQFEQEDASAFQTLGLGAD
jgi:CubicO group peptidase (beta-lactamase class C family)